MKLYGTYLVSTRKNVATLYWLALSLTVSNVPSIHREWLYVVECLLLHLWNDVPSDLGWVLLGTNLKETYRWCSTSWAIWYDEPWLFFSFSSRFTDCYMLVFLYPSFHFKVSVNQFTVRGPPERTATAKFLTAFLNFKCHTCQSGTHFFTYCLLILRWISESFFLLFFITQEPARCSSLLNAPKAAAICNMIC